MSKNNNVNPGQYKVAGRERQGEHLQQGEDKQALKQERATLERATAARETEPRTGDEQRATPEPASHAGRERRTMKSAG